MDPAMTVSLLVSKYDRARRSGEVADWTSYEDVGKCFGGRVLTEQEYRRVEDLYVSAVEDASISLGAGSFALKNVILGSPAPSWMGEVYNGQVVDLSMALDLVRSMLRDGSISCVLESDVLCVSVETDFYLAFQFEGGEAGHVAEQVEQLGLYAVETTPFDVDDDAPLVLRAADEDFWEEVRQKLDGARTSSMLLQQWAFGSYGYCWHFLEPGGVPEIAGSVGRHSLLVAFFGLNITWATRSAVPVVVSELLEADDVETVLFGYSGGRGRVSSLKCGAGVVPPTLEELPPGDTFGMFRWPDEYYPAESTLEAVVPDEDGNIIAQFPAGQY